MIIILVLFCVHVCITAIFRVMSYLHFCHRVARSYKFHWRQWPTASCSNRINWRPGNKNGVCRKRLFCLQESNSSTYCRFWALRCGDHLALPPIRCKKQKELIIKLQSKYFELNFNTETSTERCATSARTTINFILVVSEAPAVVRFLYDTNSMRSATSATGRPLLI